MTDLAQMLNDAEAANNARVAIGLLTSEEYGAEGAHPCRTETCIIVGAFEGSRNVRTDVIYWLEENCHLYGYIMMGAYVDAAILEEFSIANAIKRRAVYHPA